MGAMADFCQQCSIRFFGEDFRDLAIGDDNPDATSTDRFIVQCEGCAPIGTFAPNGSLVLTYTVVDKDGRCVLDCSEHHGTETMDSWGTGAQGEGLPS